jgi:hypothetical protein
MQPNLVHVATITTLLTGSQPLTAKAIKDATGIPLEEVWTAVANDPHFVAARFQVQHYDGRHRDDEDGCPIQPLWALAA